MGNCGKTATQIISSKTLTARLNGRSRVAMENKLAFWIWCPSHRQSSQKMLPKRK
jgi:hypothetical protein